MPPNHIVLPEAGTVRVTVESKSAGYMHDLGLWEPEAFRETIFASAGPGNSDDIGPFEGGTELVFFLYVHDTGEQYYSTGAQAVVTETGYGLWEIDWEDIDVSSPGCDHDFDDLVVSVELLPPTPTPTPTSTATPIPTVECSGAGPGAIFLHEVTESGEDLVASGEWCAVGSACDNFFIGVRDEGASAEEWLVEPFDAPCPEDYSPRQLVPWTSDSFSTDADTVCAALRHSQPTGEDADADCLTFRAGEGSVGRAPLVAGLLAVCLMIGVPLTRLLPERKRR